MAKWQTEWLCRDHAFVAENIRIQPGLPLVDPGGQG